MILNLPLHHVGIAVLDLEAAIKLHQTVVGGVVELREVLPAQALQLAFIKLPNSRIELLAPTSPESTLARFLASRGPGLHHLCYQTPDIRAELARLLSQGFKLIDHEPRHGAHNSLIAFIHPRDTGGVLLELCQPDSVHP